MRKKDGAQSVVFTGIFRGKAATATFTRTDDGWRMCVSAGGSVTRKALYGKHWKPCWTVATKFMEDMVPAKRRAAAKSRR